MKKTLFSFGLLALFLAACGGGSPSIVGEWRIVSYGPAGSPIPAVAGVGASVNFDADGKVNGNAGCNQFFGTYSVSGNTITFSAIGSTAMACLDDGRMEQEQGVLAVLSGEASYALSGNSLIITSADGALLVVLEKK
jgi:heat shock protein HslJ